MQWLNAVFVRNKYDQSSHIIRLSMSYIYLFNKWPDLEIVILIYIFNCNILFYFFFFFYKSFVELNVLLVKMYLFISWFIYHLIFLL